MKYIYTPKKEKALERSEQLQNKVFNVLDLVAELRKIKHPLFSTMSTCFHIHRSLHPQFGDSRPLKHKAATPPHPSSDTPPAWSSLGSTFLFSSPVALNYSPQSTCSVPHQTHRLLLKVGCIEGFWPDHFLCHPNALPCWAGLHFWFKLLPSLQGYLYLLRSPCSESAPGLAPMEFSLLLNNRVWPEPCLNWNFHLVNFSLQIAQGRDLYILGMEQSTKLALNKRSSQ